MRKFFIIYSLLFIVMISPLVQTFAQGSIAFSKLDGPHPFLNDNPTLKVIDGESYVLSYSQDYEIIPSITNTLTKHARDGSVIYSVNIGPDSSYGYGAMNIINGVVYLLGRSYSGVSSIVKINADGSIAFVKLMPGISIYPSSLEAITGNEMLVVGSAFSGAVFPVQMGGTVPSEDENGFVAKVNLANGEITSGVYIGFVSDAYNSLQIENGALYLANTDNDRSIHHPVTIGSPPPVPLPVNDPNLLGTYLYVEKLNISDLTTLYARYVSESATCYLQTYKVQSGELYISGVTSSPNLTVTNGSTATTGTPWDGFYTKLNADGSIGLSTYLSNPGFRTSVSAMKISNGFTYLTGGLLDATNLTSAQGLIYKIAANGSFVYTKQFDLGPYYYHSINYTLFEVMNDEVYLAGTVTGPSYPVTNGSHYQGEYSLYYTHLNSAGDIAFSGFLGTTTSSGNLLAKLDNNLIYLAGGTAMTNLLSTDGTTGHGNDDHLVIILKLDGSVLYSSYIGGNEVEYTQALQIDNGNIYINGSTYSDNYPVTDNASFQPGWKYYLTKIAFCAGNYTKTNDTLSPKIQTVCKYGLASLIHGQDIIIPSDSLPTIYTNGTTTSQPFIGGATYQWQTAISLTGPWTDIPNATLRDFLPVIGDLNQYYRRNVFMPADCGSAFIHTSDTAAVIAGILTAPILNAGENLITCPSSPIIIGGSPTATGGTPPYSYNWNMGVGQNPNPTVSAANNTIYTLIVTDAAGCQQIDQAAVLVYKADAGIDKSSCGGIPVKIGSAPVTGLPGVVYTWQPAISLTSTTNAQPFANPLVITYYDLTLVIPKSGGGTCITYDTVKVTPIAAPLIANFAGPDKFICTTDDTQLGSAAEPGFSYAWSPLYYLSNVNNSTAVFSFHDIPFTDPATIRLSAYKNGCTFSDEVIVTVIESNAGGDGCGPRIIGKPDRTPDLIKTYSWVKVSGPGNFTGATNLPQVPVSASVGYTTVYGLTVSYNGVNCYSEVNVIPDCLTGCDVGINVIAEHVCPGYSVNNGDVTLQAISFSLTDALYTWTPQEGLSAYSGNTVHLTDNIPRTYTVTATSAHDTAVHCFANIAVNDPAYVVPVFGAPDVTTCAGIPVMIGLPPVPGDSVTWIGGVLSDSTISNPLATANYTTLYQVAITNTTGCVLTDTVIVFIQDTPANAGEDWQICSNAIVTLGTPAITNTTYLWEPQTSAWQNGTNEHSAQPQVLAAANVTYALTTTSSAGCISTDEVNVVVNNSPTIPDAPDVLVCLGSGITIGSPAITGVSYQWAPITGLNDPGIAQPIAHPAMNTTYSVTATFPGTCMLPATDQVTVTVNDPSFNMPDIPFCPSDGAIQLGINAPAGMDYYFWSPYELVTDYFIANPSTLAPPPNNTTVFTLTVQNQFGCGYTDTLAIIPSINAPIAGIDRNACKDDPVSIGSISNTTGSSISYSWNPVTYLSDPLTPNPVFTGTATGTYQYVLTKTDNSINCSATDTVVITVVDILPTLNSPTVCRNSCVQIGTASIAGIEYVWSPVNGLSDPYLSNPIACIDTASITYTLTASDQSGCTTSNNVVIGVNAIPGVQASVPDVVACVSDENLMLFPSVPTGSYSYLWSPDNGTLSDINIANPAIQTTTPGIYNYNLQITDNTTGCSNTLPANVQINACSPNGQAGNFMWFDTNANGLQDTGELGVSGAVVKLYNSIGFNIATAVTDANGFYEFPEVAPGSGYYITFSKPAGYEFTLQNVGGLTATNNSKADAAGKTNNFDLTTGADISNIDAGIKTSGTVPITLLSFTAALHGRQTFLNWQTTAEINNAYFDVERSNDAMHFTAIGRINGNGTTLLPHNYSLIDLQPLNGYDYYRLKQFDFDGHFVYSTVEVVELKDNSESVTVWYNNQNNSVQLLFNKSQQSLELKLYAANGQLIRAAAATNNISSYQLDLPVLATGVYMLQAVSDKVRYSKKIFISGKR